jgi:hypothetical protein
LLLLHTGCLAPDDVALDSHAHDYYADALRFGSLRCFQHFDCALRGREELVITVPSCDARRLLVLHSPGCARLPCAVDQAAACRWRELTQARARSSEAEVDEAPVGACFLLAAYSRYSACPYVWVRLLPAFHSRRRSLGCTAAVHVVRLAARASRALQFAARAALDTMLA